MILKINLLHDKMSRYNFTPVLPHVPSHKTEFLKKSCIKTVKVVRLFVFYLSVITSGKWHANLVKEHQCMLVCKNKILRQVKKKKKKHGNQFKKGLKMTEGGARSQATVYRLLFSDVPKSSSGVFPFGGYQNVRSAIYIYIFFKLLVSIPGCCKPAVVFHVCFSSHSNSPMSSGLHHHIKFSFC